MQTLGELSALNSFQCAKGEDYDGEIACSIDFPDNIEGYGRVDIHRVNEYFSSDGINTDKGTDKCNEGEVVKTFTQFLDSSFIDQTSSQTGESFSYRACVFNTASKAVSYVTSNRVQALDQAAPEGMTSFSCSADPTGVDSIECSLDYPSNIADYYRVKVLRLAGATPPNEDCSSDGISVYAKSAFFADESFIDDVSGINNSLYSYRICITDSSGNLTTSAVSNISERIGILDGFTCVTGSTNPGDIDCAIDFPVDTDNFSMVTVLRLLGATAPNADCASDGTEVMAFDGNYSDFTFTDATNDSGSLYSYRVCTYSVNGRLMDNDQKVENILAL